VKKELKSLGWILVTDPEQVYWDPMYRKSVAIRHGKDPRNHQVPKPVLLINRKTRKRILVEWDYGKGGWIAHNCAGDILFVCKLKQEVLRKLVNSLRG
jgi:hypothetical protein